MEGEKVGITIILYEEVEINRDELCAIIPIFILSSVNCFC